MDNFFNYFLFLLFCFFFVLNVSASSAFFSEYSNAFFSSCNYNGSCEMGEDCSSCYADCKLGEGSLKIQIVPGYGTSSGDLNGLVGESVFVCEYRVGGSCDDKVINSDLTIDLSDYPIGYYTVSSKNSVFNSDEVSVSLDSFKVIFVSKDSNLIELEAFLGLNYKLVVIKDSEIVSPSDVNVLSYCEYYFEDPFEVCVGGEGVVWSDIFKVNPFVSTIALDSKSSVYSQLDKFYAIKLQYGGLTKDFNYTLQQGKNDVVLDMDPNLVWSQTFQLDSTPGIIWVDGPKTTCDNWGGRLPTINELKKKMTSNHELFNPDVSYCSSSITTIMVSDQPRNYDLVAGIWGGVVTESYADSSQTSLYPFKCVKEEI